MEEQGGFITGITGMMGIRNDAEDELKQYMLGNKDLSEEAVQLLQKQVTEGKELGTAVTKLLPGVTGFMNGLEGSLKTLRTIAMAGGPIALILAALAIIVKLAMDFAKEIVETRKELGVSVGLASSLVAQNKLLAIQGKAFGLEMQDITAAQKSIREDLGLSVQESVDLSLNFARTAAATGQTAEELGSSLSIMESMSGASREVLLNQIRSNAAMIEAAGVAPGQIMKDIASNTEFFAEFARDGGQNLIQAGVAAAKLGLSMDQVKNTTESLLNFETSIEKQMEASLLLGRQINLDRARQLALTGDQAGMMEEVLRQVGGETEFTQMNYLQRKALADSVGSTVENLSRMVRNRSASATAGVVAESGDAGQEVQRSQLEILTSSDKYLKHIADEV